MSMAILPKDYLSIRDVADYLDELGFEYDLSTSIDRYRINKDIYDLVLQKKINAVFKFLDNYNFKDAYFYLHAENAHKILIQGDLNVNIRGYNVIYRHANGSAPDLSEEGYEINEDYYLTWDDIYIPKSELDKLFHRDTHKDESQTIEELRLRITELENELENELSRFHTVHPIKSNELQTILDVNHPAHAPDLKHAIKLWIDVYIKNSIGGESHSAMADNWIAKNTKYDAEITRSDINSIKRIREVTTPLRDFGKGRSRESNK